jgi:DNA (cytosine-5)-methyltransferase 1
MGFDAEWGIIGAANIGAPHKRDRIWIMAYSMQQRPFQSSDIGQHSHIENRFAETYCSKWNEIANAIESSGKNVSNSECIRCEQMEQSNSARKIGKETASEIEYSGRAGRWKGWPPEPQLGRVAYGVANRVDRLKALGNGQVPLCAAFAWKLLSEKF